MIPVIAIVGRPNVGKSTLFNCLTKSRDAIVSNYSGLTRDRKYGRGQFEEQEFIVIDTGGIEGKEAGIDEKMLEQTELAIEEASAVIFLVDAKAGVTSADKFLAQKIRQTDKATYLLVNKTDGIDPDLAVADFYQLGLGRPIAIAAAHKRGVTAFLEECLDNIPKSDEGREKNPDSIRIAILGKPNAGKSTLVNRIMGEDRVVVYDMPGTTRDSIDVPLERHGKHYTLIDTAGIRRKAKTKETIEKFSIIKALQAMETSNVVIHVIDGRENISEQDLHLLGYILDAGRSLLIAVNKWDDLGDEDKKQVKSELARRLTFVDFAKIHFISALHGSGVGNLFDTVDAVYESATTKHSTNKLTKILEKAVAGHPPPSVNKRQIKLRYAHLGGLNPPVIVIHGNQSDKLSKDYQRYLMNIFRKELKLVGTPLRLQLNTSDNPFKDKKNKLTPGQEKKRKRLMKFHKKK